MGTCNVCGSNFVVDIDGRIRCSGCNVYKETDRPTELEALLRIAGSHLINCSFDFAEEQYSNIIDKYHTAHVHEAYWGRLLAKHGIKYISDYNGRMLPTVYSSSIDQLTTDPDYKRAVEYASQANKEYYQKQAEYIQEARAKWLELSGAEEEYDIFLCFKDTDGTPPQTTKDSHDVADLYNLLTKKKYKVFCSKYSLQNVIGRNYEPYIFDAIQKAKMMIVYSSSVEYINSTWMRNEWMRYALKITNGDKAEGSLLVAYKGFSPNDLPTNLQKQQALDADNSMTFSSQLLDRIRDIIGKPGEYKQKRDNRNRAISTVLKAGEDEVIQPHTEQPFYAEIPPIGQKIAAPVKGDAVITATKIAANVFGHFKSFFTDETTGVQKAKHWIGWSFMLSVIALISMLSIYDVSKDAAFINTMILIFTVWVDVNAVALLLTSIISYKNSKAKSRTRLYHTAGAYVGKVEKFISNVIFVAMSTFIAWGVIYPDFATRYCAVVMACISATWYFVMNVYAHCPRECKSIQLTSHQRPVHKSNFAFFGAMVTLGLLISILVVSLGL